MINGMKNINAISLFLLLFIAASAASHQTNAASSAIQSSHLSPRPGDGEPERRSMFEMPSTFDFYNNLCHDRCEGIDDLLPFLNSCPQCPDRYSSAHCNNCCQGGASSIKMRWHGCPATISFASTEQLQKHCGVESPESGSPRFVDCECYDTLVDPVNFDAFGCVVYDTITIPQDVKIFDICIVSTKPATFGTQVDQEILAIDFSKPLPEVLGLINQMEGSIEDHHPRMESFATYFDTSCSIGDTSSPHVLPIFPGYGKFPNTCHDIGFIDFRRGNPPLPVGIDHFVGSPPREAEWFKFVDGTSVAFWPAIGGEDAIFFNPSFAVCSCSNCSSDVSSITPSAAITYSPKPSPEPTAPRHPGPLRATNVPSKHHSVVQTHIPSRRPPPQDLSQSPSEVIDSTSTVGPSHDPTVPRRPGPIRGTAVPSGHHPALPTHEPSSRYPPQDLSQAPSEKLDSTSTTGPSPDPTVPRRPGPIRGNTELPSSLSSIMTPTNSPTTLPTALPSIATSSFPTAVTSELTSSARPTGFPSNRPIPLPTALPSIATSSQPTFINSELPSSPIPTSTPTNPPTALPTALPSIATTSSPTAVPSELPSSARPTEVPSDRPTQLPTALPSIATSSQPTLVNSESPSSVSPSTTPTNHPTQMPTALPSIAPSSLPTGVNSELPSSKSPTEIPSDRPTRLPTALPSIATSSLPTFVNSDLPSSSSPTTTPTNHPTQMPTALPSVATSSFPTGIPSELPSSKSPTGIPSDRPTRLPTALPSIATSSLPTFVNSDLPSSSSPTTTPTNHPTHMPTALPSIATSSFPTTVPSELPSYINPTAAPTSRPTKLPTVLPSIAPSSPPTFAKSELPMSVSPTATPSSPPTALPTALPSLTTSSFPTAVTSELPSSASPTGIPSNRPTPLPSALPSIDSSIIPTVVDSELPSSASPTTTPTNYPTQLPSALVSTATSSFPTAVNSELPSSVSPTATPTSGTMQWPTARPSIAMSSAPTVKYELQTSSSPTLLRPTLAGTSPPTLEPDVPSVDMETSTPTQSPSVKFDSTPTRVPSTETTIPRRPGPIHRTNVPSMDLSVTTTPTNPDGPSAGSGLQTDTISPSDRGTANQPSPSPSEDIAPTFTANESPKPTIGRLPEPNRPTSGPSKHTHKPYVRTDAPSDRLFSQSPSQSPSGGSEPMSPLEPLHEPTISPRPEPSIWTQAPSIDSPVAPTAPTADEPSHLAPQSEAPSLPRSIFPSTFVPSSSFPTFPPTLESPGFLSVEPTFTARIPTLFPSKDPTVPEVTPNSVAPTSEFTDIGLPTSTGKCTLEDVRQCNSAASSQCISIKPQSDFSRGECRFEVENPNGLSSLREKGRRGYSENEIVSRLAYHKERLALLRLNNS